MKSRTTHTHKKNQVFWAQRESYKGLCVTEFFSQPAIVYSAHLGRVYDEYGPDLTEDWTFIGESEDWEVLTKHSPAV